MNTTDLFPETAIPYLPPILVGFGGVILILIKKSPVHVRKQLMLVYVAILIIVVWIPFLCLLFWGERIIGYGSAWTLIFLLVGLAVLISFFILRGKQRYNERSNFCFALYIAGLFFISAAASNYALPEGKVMLEVELDEGEILLFPSDSEDASTLRTRITDESHIVIIDEETFKTMVMLIVRDRKGADKGEIRFTRKQIAGAQQGWQINRWGLGQRFHLDR